VIITAVDPGGTTGVCLYGTDKPLEPELLELPNGVMGVSDWWRNDRPLCADAIVMESFRLDGRTEKPDLSPVEIIGWAKVKFSAQKFGGQYIYFQTPAQAKSIITNDVLKRAGLYPKRGNVKGGHGIDALRHALYYLAVTVKHRETIELLWPKEEA
jgi:hypothetical protein